MKPLLQEPRFDFIPDQDKAFMVAFNDEMARLGYDFGNKIGDGYCWGKYMVIYTRTGVKSKNVYTRLYFRDPRIILRLFLSGIDEHRAFLEVAPARPVHRVSPGSSSESDLVGAIHELPLLNHSDSVIQCSQ
ncbi:MAG: hypothetical protein JW987_10270 [Anaerolineaceae bacterium]|nr:hypothetical protein [Anaerolineaceae bacterium]